MTQEEKAKAYDEAIERAKKCLDETRDNCFVSPDVIFPELKVKESKESEDERIRKDLIVFLVAFWHLGRNGSYDSWTKADCSDWLAWVEKQGKKVDVIENLDTEFEKQVSRLLASVLNKDYEYTEGFVKWVSSNLLGYAKYEIEKQSPRSQSTQKSYTTIEQKEQDKVKKVDFAKEFDDFTEYLGLTDKFTYFSDIEQTAKFFFQLGLKAQK